MDEPQRKMEGSGEFLQSLEKIEFVYKLCGLRLFSSDKNLLKIRCIYLFNFLCLNGDVAATMTWFIEGIRTGKDFVSLTYIAPCICYTYLADFKTLFLIREERFMHQLIDDLNKMEAKSEKFFSLAEKKKIEGNERDFLHRLIKVQNVMYVVLLLGFVIAPLSLIVLNYTKTGEIKLILPFLAIYPFDAFDIRIWPIVYVHQAWSTVVVLIFVSAADYFFYVCCTYIRMQFKLLQNEIERMISSSHRTCENVLQVTNSDFNGKFKELVIWHQELIRSAETLEIIYAKSTLYNFVSSSALICLTLFNVTVIKDVAFVITFMSFLIMCLLQIYFLCYFGDMISQSSIEVSDAIYNSLWYIRDSYVGKQLLLVLMRSQKPCKLTALGFADVNLRAFMKIMSNAWSYFALLKTIYN